MKPGDIFDNAMAESFPSKNKLVLRPGTEIEL